MNSKIYPKITVLIVLASAVFFIHSVFAQNTPAPANLPDITYPVKELGNCKNQGACRAYCNDKANMAVCAQFAYQHGMIDQNEASDAMKYSEILKNGGPGGCTTQASCVSYCDQSSHLEECLSFAEKNKLIEVKDFEKAQKVLKALNSGETTPGQCKNQKDCENYCKESGHFNECISFAEKSGLMSSEELDQAKKIMPFIENGETPGKCATKDQCEEYCSSEDHFNECISFAEKAGLVSAEEAQMARKAGGVGPGGCRSQAACESYCNQDANAAECLNFAKEKGILSPDKIKEIEDGMGRLRTGLGQMPEEMISCLKSSIGEDVLGKIESGDFVPGPGIGTKIQSCVDQYAPKLRATLDKAFEMATPEIMACLSNSLGQERLSAVKSGENPTPKEGDEIKNCFESMRQEGLKKAMEGLSKMPPEMLSCVKQKLGADIVAKIQAGDKEALGPESEGAFKSCIENFQEKMKQEKGSKEGFGPGGDFKTNMPMLPGIPKEVPERGMMPSQRGEGQSAPGGTGDICGSFASVPSCSYVPDNVRDQCEKCKGN